MYNSTFSTTQKFPGIYPDSSGGDLGVMKKMCIKRVVLLEGGGRIMKHMKVYLKK